MISLFVFFGIYYLLYSKILYEYIFLCTSLFLVGYLDDMKITSDFDNYIDSKFFELNNDNTPVMVHMKVKIENFWTLDKFLDLR